MFFSDKYQIHTLSQISAVRLPNRAEQLGARADGMTALGNIMRYIVVEVATVWHLAHNGILIDLHDIVQVMTFYTLTQCDKHGFQ